MFSLMIQKQRWIKLLAHESKTLQETVLAGCIPPYHILPLNKRNKFQKELYLRMS